MNKPYIAYFDNAATTYVKPKEVHDFMHEFYMANSVNLGRGSHQLLEQGQQILSETRSMLKKLFHATSEYEAVFTPSATIALNTILQGQNWAEGDTVYISPFEHNAVYRTVKYLEKEKGVKIKELEFDKSTLMFIPDRIRKQFNDERPKMVIATHVSNVCGNIIDIEVLGKIVKEYQSKFLVDCAQSAGLLDINILTNQADYIVFAGHKTLYGPFGCSGFICRKDDGFSPLIYGGTGVDSASEIMPLDVPSRFEAGSCNLLSVAGLYAALNWQKNIGIENIRAKEHENYESLVKALSLCNDIEIVGNTKSSTSIVSCTFKLLPPDSAERFLSQNGIIVRSGLHCAPLAHKFLGTFPAGTVRFSVSYFTKANDLHRLNETISTMEEEV